MRAIRGRGANLVEKNVRKVRLSMSDGLQKEEMRLLEREAGCICILPLLCMEEKILMGRY